MPIGADSTASGLQLLSAMRTDRTEMFYSNLLPIKDINEAPRDAYSKVLEIALEAAESSDETLGCLGLFTIGNSLNLFLCTLCITQQTLELDNL